MKKKRSFCKRKQTKDLKSTGERERERVVLEKTCCFAQSLILKTNHKLKKEEFAMHVNCTSHSTPAVLPFSGWRWRGGRHLWRMRPSVLERRGRDAPKVCSGWKWFCLSILCEKVIHKKGEARSKRENTTLDKAVAAHHGTKVRSFWQHQPLLTGTICYNTRFPHSKHEHCQRARTVWSLVSIGKVLQKKKKKHHSKSCAKSNQSSWRKIEKLSVQMDKLTWQSYIQFLTDF